MISSGGIPLALALGVRGIRLASPGWLVAAWLVAAWQLSLGFAIGLPFAYLLGLLVLVGAVVWWRRGRPPVDRRLLAAGAAGLVAFLVIAGLIARPYFRVADAHPEATRPPSTVEAYSGPLAAFAAAPEENLVWGDVTEPARDGLENVPEKTLFPGVAILLLAAVGLGSSAFPRRLRVGLGAGVVATWVLALGFQEEDGWLWPYRIVYELLPGWEAIRTPGQAADVLVARARAARGRGDALGPGCGARPPRGELGSARPRAPRALTAMLAALIALAVVVEGRGLPFDPFDDQAQPEVRRRSAARRRRARPPASPARPWTAEDNRRYLLWSTDGFPRIVNGRASTVPDSIEALIERDGRLPRPGDGRAAARARGATAWSCTPTASAASPQAMALREARRGPRG